MDETTIDRAAMGRLAKALNFICGAEHPCVKALALASETGLEKDVKAARAQFLKLTSSDRRAAMGMIEERE